MHEATAEDVALTEDSSQTLRHSLERSAVELATAHAATGRAAPAARMTAARAPGMIARLEQQTRLMKALQQQYAQTATDDLAAPNAAEWVLDNYYVFEQATRQIREDYSSGYERSLPWLTTQPRIAAVAWEIVTQLSGVIGVDDIARFLHAYQEIAPLTIGEVWALPIMLRAAVLELLTQTLLALSPVRVRNSLPPLSAVALHAEPDEGVVANCFRSLRVISAQDWKVVFEDISLVERELRRDPAGVYPRMDFDTRNRYRSVVESMALRSGMSELDVAQRAIVMARAECEADVPGQSCRQHGHVGYFLVAQGAAVLERAIGYKPARAERAQRWLLARPTSVYLGSIAVLTALMMAVLLTALATRAPSPAAIVLAAVLSAFPTSTIAVTAMNWLISLILPPRLLPRLDFEKGVPDSFRTIVVVPTLLAPDDSVRHLTQQLELHYLRNNQANLSFALLTDFADAPQQHMPEDASLAQELRTAVEALNVKYATNAFYLFHRERRWNAAEGCWMGWERKRGKLAEFNRLLRGADDTSYVVRSGDMSRLPGITYVITLDADTVLTRDSAHALIATLAHPLNHAVFDPASGRVVSGYTVLQPRTEVLPASAGRSLFAKLFAGDTGLDLYTNAVSDTYQDLFGSGAYVGKGIYAVDDFERSLHDRVPENALLSHDLFEGSHGRAGLVTDIVLLEDYPPNYLTYMRRAHRWIRGDWQLLPWLFAQVPTAHGRGPNVLAPIDRWKMLDNLRRSLTAPALMALLLAGWFWLPGSFLTWTLITALTLSMSVFISAVNAGAALLSRAGGVRRKASARPIWMDAARALLALTFLPYEALLSLDAIATSLWRLLVSHKRMLEWTSAAHTMRLIGRNVSLGVTTRQMTPALVAALTATAALALLAWTNPLELIGGLPMLSAWLLSPLVAYWLGRPSRRKSLTLSDAQRWKLRALARQTWMFFEHFVGPHDNWLPPDHFQEQPVGIIAHQTSPTNIGLYLLSALAAHDFGYIRSHDLALRLQATLDSMSRLERHRGHFLNWYDTRTLAPLPPPYVSTVDSGNLAACLMTLRQGRRDVLNAPLMRWEQLAGLQDVLAWMDQVVSGSSFASAGEAVQSLRAQLAAMLQEIEALRDEPGAWLPALRRLRAAGRSRLGESVVAVINSRGRALSAAAIGDLSNCVERLDFHLDDLHDEWCTLSPVTAALLQHPFPPALDGVWRKAGDELQAAMPMTTTLAHCPQACTSAQQALVQVRALGMQLASALERRAALAWCDQLDEALDVALAHAQTITAMLQSAVAMAETFANEMAFGFLFDTRRQIFHIGYTPTDAVLDANYYDLLASEARITSLVAIAKGDVPASHWLNLARPLTLVDGERALLSWSGTMFEYLMPMLLVRSYEGMFLDQSCRAAVDCQIRYGKRKGVPWGISESGYFAFDANLNHQYRAFGVPSLGFKRGLADDLVVAPYATVLALPIRPFEALRNIEGLEALRARGRYGLFESIDFTQARLAPGVTHEVVQSYMAHHHAMSLVSLLNVLHDNIMVSRFHADPRVKSVELLLQERIPQQAPADFPNSDETAPKTLTLAPVVVTPWSVPVDTPHPHAHVLSNGRFTTMITNAGTGYSQCGGVALTRWQADPTLDNTGVFVYLHDQERDATWSLTAQPAPGMAREQSVSFQTHQAEFHCTAHEIHATMRVAVAPDDDVEVRLVTIANHSNVRRRLRVCSYGEVLLGSREADQRHPAFSKLFVQSEYVPGASALVFRRRPRAATEPALYLSHSLTLGPDAAAHATQGACESDRARFIGRGRNMRSPAALSNAAGLSGSTGPLLDPVMALSQDIVLEPSAHVQLAWVTSSASTRDDVLSLAVRFQNWREIDAVFDAARHKSEADVRASRLSTTDLSAMEQVLSALLYPSPALRAAPDVLASNSLSQTGLYAFGLSGDLPILLLRVREQHAPVLRAALRAHAYWRNRQVSVNLVLLNEQDSGYEQTLDQYLHRLLARSGNAVWLNRRDGIFVIRASQLTEQQRSLLLSSARVILDNSLDTLAEQTLALQQPSTPLPRLVADAANSEEHTQPVDRPRDLRFDNGLGGFSADGCEYVIYLEPGQNTPVPWTNVIANPEFGCLTSEAGLGSTWAGNSGENRLTPWRNDPVLNAAGEAIYLRDEETADVWSPTPAPAPALAPYLIRHGAGYTQFEHASHGLLQALRVYVAPDAPVKLMRLRLTNTLARRRRITVTYYAEWVLGTTPENTRPFVVPDYDGETQSILARNAHSGEFGSQVAFVASNKPVHGLTTSRAEFLGRMGSLSQPDALTRVGLSGSLRAGGDPCAALQVHVDLEAGAVEELHFVLGEAADRASALSLAARYRQPEQAQAAWLSLGAHWDAVLGTIAVETPEPAMNLMLNRWLLYQAIACRLWGRTALYQSSGAFGFRDQLQDALALLHAAPKDARQVILNAARHQFTEGDVLHWWHPPFGRGVRTHCSDDLLWLPYVTAEYIAVTGDRDILSETLSFLSAEPLALGDEDRYAQFPETAETATLYEHCARALRKGLTAGAHGLPLIGSGDWNDGMNRVGIEGRGESVWLGWFLNDTLKRFADVAALCGDAAQAGDYRAQAARIAGALEAEAWDGAWYRRAYYDDGATLGSASDAECQIDSIAQSWAVLSGAAQPERARQAMNAVYERLVLPDAQAILLFAPPFDATPRDPGYIKGYPPGIRENGGQYTHAAVWAAWAFADLGDHDRAASLFALLNPIGHGDSAEKVGRYKVEPYVIAADVYGHTPHVGRGGWTWYTGSAGWMYRLGIEGILGLRKCGNRLHICPRLPGHWPGFRAAYRVDAGENTSVYRINVIRDAQLAPGATQMWLDGCEMGDGYFDLLADGHDHAVVVATP